MTEQPLSDEDIAGQLPGSRWRHEDGAIIADFELENFAAAIAAVNRIAAVAEERNHHPDILVHGWNQLTLTLSTHSVGGVTAADLDLAVRLDTVL